MKSNPFPRGVNVAPPEPARTRREAEPAPQALTEGRRDSQMNRDARALLAAARALQEQLDAFRAEHDGTSLGRELVQGGRIDLAQNPRAYFAACDAEGALGAEIDGFAWVLAHFARALEAQTLPAGD